MDEPTRKSYRPWEPQRYAQQTHSPLAQLPEGDLVFFLLDTIPHLDLGRFYAHYEAETHCPLSAIAQSELGLLPLGHDSPPRSGPLLRPLRSRDARRPAV